MKSKWLKKAMAAFLAVLMTVCALPVAAFVPETVETGEEFEQDFSEDSSEKNTSLSSDCWGNYGYTGYSTTINGVKVPLNEWPVGSYWTTDGKKRTSTSDNASLSFDGGRECYGFARYVYYKVFGVHENSSNDTVKVVGSMAASSITLTYLKNLFLDGTVVPGAHIRTKASGHSMIYMGADSTYIYTYECNSASAGSDGVYPCDVTVRRRNWTQMYNYLTIQKAGIDFISQPKNAGNVTAYDGYLYTQYNDPDGVHSINAQAAVGNQVGTIPTEDGSGCGYVVVTQYSSDGKWGYVNYKGIVGWTRLYEPYIKLVSAYTCPVVTFNANGGSVGTASKKVFINTPYGTLPAPTRTGYYFAGWYTAASGGSLVKEDTNVSITSNQTLYAHWTPYTYTVSYNANGGTGAPGNQTKTHDQSLTLSSVKPTKDGYTFQGWSTSSTGSVQYNPGSAYTGNANLTLYAVWNPVKYPIYFNANGGTGAPGTQYQTHFEYLTLSSVVPKKDGYTFKGWSTTLNGSVAYQPGGQFGENRSVTLYAVWSESSYSVWLDPNGGSIQTFSVTVTHNSLYGALPKPVRVDYTFTGWYTAKEGGTRVTSETVVSSTVPHTLYAHWNRQKWIGMYPNGGDGETEWTCLEYPGEFVNIPTSCYTRAGYKMIGWSTSKTATVPEYGLDKEYIVITYDENGDIKLYAVWEAIPVTSITLNQTTASLKKGETLTLTATVAPSDAANKSVTWSSGNTSVATVSTSGVVTAVGEGTAVITVKTADGGKTATCTVAVAHTHNYTGTYYEAAHPHKAYSKCSCGEINYTGATQKVASCASCYPVTGVTLDKTTATLKKGETLTLSVTVSPSDAANKAFTVTSSNPSVMSAKYGIGICVGDLFDGSACTASHCEFTVLSAGSTTLTFTTEDGQKTASCKVTVTEPVVNAKAKFTLSEASGRPGDTVKITLSLKTEETVNSIAISGITYDKSIMTFTGFSDYEHIEDLTILPPTFDEEKMAIVIGLKNAAAFDGDICTLNFKINENALEGVTNIDASSVVKLKSAEIPSAVASGKVNIRLQTLGDIDGNDTVDIDDAVLLFQYSMLPELYPISYAGNLDFNKDGTVDIDDAVRLFQYSMLPDLYPLE